VLLPLFVGGSVIDDLRLTPDRNRPQEERTVVKVHTGMAPYDLKKEEEAHFIAPSLGSRQVQPLSFPAMRAGVQSNSAHDDSFKSFRWLLFSAWACLVLGAATLKHLSLPAGTVSLALG
jgi:hypothetical protein